jgi:hypothetical protein
MRLERFLVNLQLTQDTDSKHMNGNTLKAKLRVCYSFGNKQSDINLNHRDGRLLRTNKKEPNSSIIDSPTTEYEGSVHAYTLRHNDRESELF